MGILPGEHPAGLSRMDTTKRKQTKSPPGATGSRSSRWTGKMAPHGGRRCVGTPQVGSPRTNIRIPSSTTPCSLPISPRTLMANERFTGFALPQGTISQRERIGRAVRLHKVRFSGAPLAARWSADEMTIVDPDDEHGRPVLCRRNFRLKRKSPLPSALSVPSAVKKCFFSPLPSALRKLLVVFLKNSRSSIRTIFFRHPTILLWHQLTQESCFTRFVI